MANYKDRLCVICGSSYAPSSPKQKVCMSEKCIAENRRRSDKERYKKRIPRYERACLICHRSFLTSDSRKVYCGSGECERERCLLKSRRVEKKRL